MDYARHSKVNTSQQAITQAQALADRHHLPMRFLGFKEHGPNGLPTLTFTAPERLDFRDLVRDLNDAFNTKVMLYQVMGRERAANIGGLGPCGQEICCAKWLDCPINVPVSQLRQENNKYVIAGTLGACGHPCCCLMYERDDLAIPKRQVPQTPKIPEPAEETKQELTEKKPMEIKAKEKFPKKKPVRKLVRKLVRRRRTK